MFLSLLAKILIPSLLYPSSLTTKIFTKKPPYAANNPKTLISSSFKSSL